MLSAIILAEDRAAEAHVPLRAVARSLAALVPFVVTDLIADATIVARSGVDFAEVEQSAGCSLETDADMGAALRRAMARTRRDRLLVLRAGFAPEPAFADEMVRAIEHDTRGFARSLRAEPGTFLQRLLPALAPAVAIVAHRAAVTDKAQDRAVTVARLAQACAAHPMRAIAIRV